MKRKQKLVATLGKKTKVGVQLVANEPDERMHEMKIEPRAHM
jgi:hypothetical protein